MLKCESCQLLLADALYEPLDASQSNLMQQHLDACDECRAHAAGLQQAKLALEEKGIGHGNYDDIPERAALDKLWDALQPELNRIDAERYRQLPKRSNQKRVAGWLALAASLALIITTLPLMLNDEVAIPPNNISMISPELMKYLSRAEVMLLQMANSETQNAAPVAIRQTFARDMAQEANVLHASMQDEINSGQSRLLKDIEFLLMQIANLDDSNMEQGVRLLQQYLEDNSVLLKIRLLEMRAQEVFI